jgi:hypothetical protein
MNRQLAHIQVKSDLLFLIMQLLLMLLPPLLLVFALLCCCCRRLFMHLLQQCQARAYLLCCVCDGCSSGSSKYS